MDILNQYIANILLLFQKKFNIHFLHSDAHVLVRLLAENQKIIIIILIIITIIIIIVLIIMMILMKMEEVIIVIEVVVHQEM